MVDKLSRDFHLDSDFVLHIIKDYIEHLQVTEANWEHYTKRVNQGGAWGGEGGVAAASTRLYRSRLAMRVTYLL